MQPPSSAWHDAQYDNRARNPGFATILKQWADRSAEARERLDGVLDVAYGDDPSERLDVFPAAAAGAPVLVYLHGGYWRALDKRDQSFVAPPFVAAGAMVVVPNYALCPAVTIEHIVDQVARAVGWVRRHAAGHGGDASRLVVAGHSAGGHLAALLLADASRSGVDRALSISGVFELEPLRHAPFLAPDLRLDAASAARLSPALLPAPPGRLVALVGADESEEFLRQSAALAAAWGPGTVVAHEAVAGRHHLDVLGEIAEPTSRVHHWARWLLGLDAERPDAAGR